MAAGERRVCALIARLSVYGSAEQWKASGQGFCPQTGSPNPKPKPRTTPEAAFLQKYCAKACARPRTHSPAARRRPEAPPQRICCKNTMGSKLRGGSKLRSAKLQRRALCVAIVIRTRLRYEKSGRGGVAIFAGLDGFDPLRVDACADSRAR